MLRQRGVWRENQTIHVVERAARRWVYLPGLESATSDQRSPSLGLISLQVIWIFKILSY